MKPTSIIILLALLLTTNCKFSFLIDALRPTSYYKCIKPSTDGQITLILICDDEQCDDSLLQNIQNALAAGMTIQLLILPYRCRSVEEEIKFLSSKIDIKVIKRFWGLLSAVNDCSWEDHQPTENCQHLQELIRKWKAVDVDMEIIAATNSWAQAFGSQSSCPQPSTTSLLWWLDQDPYQPTGGWKTPNLTFVTMANLCGEEIYVSRVNLNHDQNLRSA